MSHSSSEAPRANSAQLRACTSATSAGNASVTHGFVSCSSTTPPRTRVPLSRLKEGMVLAQDLEADLVELLGRGEVVAEGLLDDDAGEGPAGAPVAPVAAVAAFVSYRHLSGLLGHYGEETLIAHLGPLAVDGLMVMATAALLTGRTQPVRPAPEPAVNYVSVPAAADRKSVV